MTNQMMKNLDAATVKSFGDGWSRYDRWELSAVEAGRIFDEYFAVSFLGINCPRT